MRFLFILLASLLNISLLTAQKYYLEGNTTNTEGVKQSGLIDYRDWKYNPEIIRFIPDGSKIPLLFSPSSLKSFSVNNEKFISAEVTIERTPDKFNELLYSRERIISEEQVFLRVLVEGETSLFYYNEKKSGKHLYIKKGATGEITELARYSTISEIEGKRELIVKDEYKDQLENLIRDCRMVTPLIHLADYTMEDLTELVEEYNTCIGKEIDYIADLPKIKFHLVVSAGLSAYKVNFYSSDPDDLAAADFSTSYRPSVAAGLDIVFPSSRKAFSIYNELGILSYNTHGETQWYVNEDNYTDVEINLAAIELRLLNAVKYTMPSRGVKPFIYAGLVNIYGFNTGNSKTTFTHFYTTETEQTDIAITVYRRYSQALVAGIGISYRNMNLDLRYVPGNDITSSMDVSSSTSAVFVLAQYVF